MQRRAFAETLIDLAAAVDVSVPSIRIDEVTMTLPLEVRLGGEGRETTLLAELPVWRWRTEFDPQPSRLRVTWIARAES
jgi:hypothetical protein